MRRFYEEHGNVIVVSQGVGLIATLPLAHERFAAASGWAGRGPAWLRWLGLVTALMAGVRAAGPGAHWCGWSGAREEPIGMNNLKRFTVCKLANHKWLKIGYPPGADGETSGHYLRCERCGKENHDAGAVARGAGPIV